MTSSTTPPPALEGVEEVDAKARYAMSKLRTMASADWAARYEHDSFFLQSADAISALLSSLAGMRSEIERLREVLRLIGFDLSANTVPLRTRVEVALERTRAALQTQERTNGR